MFLSQITEEIRLDSLGILLESEVEADFRIEIEDIKVINLIYLFILMLIKN